MRVNLQPAYIMHSRPYRDSSALLDVFTAEYGRISLVARGARRQSRRGSSAALLQPFIPLLLSFSGRSELKTLVSIEPVPRVFALRNDRIFSGMYLNELLVRLLHRNDPYPSLFSAYNEALQELAATDRVDTVLRHFEYQLLGELGYNFDLALDATSGESVHTTSEYCYEPGVGLVPADSAGDSKRAVYTGAQLLAMASGDFDSARAAAKRLLREALAEHLGSAPLRSRELFRATTIRSALPSQLIVSTIASLGDSP